MVGLGQYAVASAVAAGAVVYHAFHTLEQFYPAMLYLATSKISVVVLGNMALVLTVLFGQLLKALFLGALREAEVERLYELSRHEIMETCLAMTIFREEFDAPFVAMFAALLFVKIFHWLAQKRLEYMETTPAVPRLAHARIVAFMALLLVTDSLFLRHSVAYLLRTRRPSVLLLFAFEYMILASSVVATFLKYALYAADVLMEGRWDNKAVYIFYLELVRDLLHLFVYLVFFLIIFIYYGLPLHLVRDLYETFRNFKARVADFIRYRRITSNLNDRFADATAEELERGDATCIICREEMAAAKKLPCGHLFHVHCLRSWLERQQTCPTCRSPLLGPEPAPAANAAPPGQGNAAQDGAAHNGPQGYPAAAFVQYGVAPGGGNYEGQAAGQAQMNAVAAAAAAQYGLAAMYQPWRPVNPPWVHAYVPYMGHAHAQALLQQQQQQEQQQQQPQQNPFAQDAARMLADMEAERAARWHWAVTQGAAAPMPAAAPAAAAGNDGGGLAGDPPAAGQAADATAAVMSGLQAESLRLQAYMHANARLAATLAAVQAQSAQLALGGWPIGPMPIYGGMYRPVGLAPYPPYARGIADDPAASGGGAFPFNSAQRMYQTYIEQLAQQAELRAGQQAGPHSAVPPSPATPSTASPPGATASPGQAVPPPQQAEDSRAGPPGVTGSDSAGAAGGAAADVTPQGREEGGISGSAELEAGARGGIGDGPPAEDGTPAPEQGTAADGEVEMLRRMRRQRYEASGPDGA